MKPGLYANIHAKRERIKELNKPGVTIRTTEYGIPRITADSWRGLGYGYGYALAKENICSMADIYTSVRGERSKLRARFHPRAGLMGQERNSSDAF